VFAVVLLVSEHYTFAAIIPLVWDRPTSTAGDPFVLASAAAQDPQGVTIRDSAKIIVPGVPSDGSGTAQAGSATSITRAAFLQSGLDVGFSHSHSALDGGIAGTSANLFFLVTEDTPYRLSGTYDLAGASLSALDVHFTAISAADYEQRTGVETTVYYDYEEIFDFPPETYTSTFPEHGRFGGEATGLLSGGQYYHLNFAASSFSRGGGTASGEGQFSLSFGTVPEPSAGLVCAAILAACGMSRTVARARFTVAGE
jgi:hypothetical protein